MRAELLSYSQSTAAISSQPSSLLKLRHFRRSRRRSRRRCRSRRPCKPKTCAIHDIITYILVVVVSGKLRQATRTSTLSANPSYQQKYIDIL